MALLAKWKCHKIVKAGRITEVRVARRELMVEMADRQSQLVAVGMDFFNRKEPVVGDYYVEYEDGYASWSPRDAFLAGYNPYDASKDTTTKS